MFIAGVVAWGVTASAAVWALGDLFLQWFEQWLARRFDLPARRRRQ